MHTRQSTMKPLAIFVIFLAVSSVAYGQGGSNDGGNSTATDNGSSSNGNNDNNNNNNNNDNNNNNSTSSNNNNNNNSTSSNSSSSDDGNSTAVATTQGNNNSSSGGLISGIFDVPFTVISTLLTPITTPVALVISVVAKLIETLLSPLIWGLQVATAPLNGAATIVNELLSGLSTVVSLLVSNFLSIASFILANRSSGDRGKRSTMDSLTGMMWMTLPLPFRLAHSLYNIVVSPIGFMYNILMWPLRFVFGGGGNDTFADTALSTSSSFADILPIKDMVDSFLLTLSNSSQEAVTEVLLELFAMMKKTVLPILDNYVVIGSTSALVPDDMKKCLKDLHTGYSLLRAMGFL